MIVRASDAPSVEERSVALAVAFSEAAIADPSIFDGIPMGVGLALIPDDDPELAAREIKAGLGGVHSGHNVYFCHVRYAPEGNLTVQRPRPSLANRHSVRRD